MDCLFCQIAKKEMGSNILYEDDKYLAFLDLNQEVAEGHTLIIPKKHFEDINEVDDITISEMFKIAKELNLKIMKKLNKTASTFLFNYGESQQVKHLHLHILPNFQMESKTRSVDEIYAILKD